MTRLLRILAVLAVAMAAAPAIVAVFVILSAAHVAGALSEAWRRFSSFPDPE